MCSVGKMNTSLTILLVFESEGLEKTFIDFSNNGFLIEIDIKNLLVFLFIYLFILIGSFRFLGSLKMLISSFNLICCSSMSSIDKSLL